MTCQPNTNNKHKYFVNDPFGYYVNEENYFDTLEKAIERGKLILLELQDISHEGWPSDYYMKQFGIFHNNTKLYEFKQINYIERPDDVDEFGYSKTLDNYWDDQWSYICEYELAKTTTQTQLKL